MIQLLLADTVLSVDWVVSRVLSCLDAGKQKGTKSGEGGPLEVSPTSSHDSPASIGTLVSLSVTLASLAQGDNIGLDLVDWRKD